MIKENDIIDVKIIDTGCNLEGIAKVDGVVLFVPYAIAGETVKVQVINTKQKAYICKVLEIIEPSEHRVEPRCPYFKKCGGCQVQHVSYPKQLALKTRLVDCALNNIGKLDVKVEPCVACDRPYEYRNKLAFPFNPISGKLGMFRNNSHNIVDIDDCSIQEPWASDLIKIVNTWVEKHNISVYDEEKNSGLLKHLVARCVNGQSLFTFVINGKTLPHSDDLVSQLSEKFDNFGLNININTKKSNAILTFDYKHIAGIKSIKCEENGIKYEITNASFLQVNNDIKSKIYDEVLKEIEGEIVIDAYSGAGLLSAMISRKAERVYGIEIVPDATKSADELCKTNGIKNLTNICGDTSVELPKITKGLKSFSLVLDPPRKGCDAKVIETILKTKPRKIVHVSCNPSTLARDLSGLKAMYDVQKITPYDMFPETCHVETLAVLKLKQF